MKYDIKVNQLDTHIRVYTLEDGKLPEKIKVDLYLSNNQWRVNWSACGDQDIEFADEFMAVMKKAIKIMIELNLELWDKAIKDAGL